MRYFLLVAAVVALSSIASAQVIRDIRGWSDGKVVRIEWYAGDETGCTGYVVMRRSGMEGSFMTISASTIPLEDDKHYVFVDESAFRTTDNFYQYRVIPLGTSEKYDVSVTHSTSGVRRTWGSIKAMFR